MVLLWLLTMLAARAGEVIPPVPPNHFNDYAGLVPAATAQQLDRQLAQFERDTSTQIVVAIFPAMQSASSVEDYTVRVAQAWKVGRQSRNNGAVLFVFAQEHQIYIQTGYGLEPSMPDAMAKRIIEEVMVPRFRQADYAGGIGAGVQAMMAAVRGEYRGSGDTVAEESGRPYGLLVLAAVFVLVLWSSCRRHMLYESSGRRGLWSAGPWIFPAGGGFGGGGGSSGGGFSGGGGRFGGGGAGGKW